MLEIKSNKDEEFDKIIRTNRGFYEKKDTKYMPKSKIVLQVQ